MKVLVHPHLMEVGGSQLNAIELAAAVRDRGHEVVVYAPPGVLVEEVRRRGLEFLPAPATRRMTPSPASARRLRRVVADGGFDLVHAYEWTAALDAMYGPGWADGTPVLATVLSMVVPRQVPAAMPLIVGTDELRVAEAARRPEVHLIEPPIDLVANRAGAAPTMQYDGRAVTVRERWGIEADEALVVLVGRLSPGLKIGGVLEAIRATELVRTDRRVRLIIAGDGPERARVDELAAQVNRAAGRELVIVAGLVREPRPLYDAADVVLGMGGSILRGMAFGKPVIVQGEHGFWSRLDESTVGLFRYQGWFGLGDGEDGAPLLAEILDGLLDDPVRAAELAEFGHGIVRAHYGLDAAADDLERIYGDLLARRRSSVPARLGSAASTTARLGRDAGGRALRAVEGALGVRVPRPSGRAPAGRERSWS